MLKNTRLRRTVGAVLIAVGGLAMWLAPGPTFTGTSAAGLALLVAGIALEAVGIALEHRNAKRDR